MPPILTKTPLTFHDKFRIYEHQAFGPPALVFPALGAGLGMADPPKNYPHDWVDGGVAFGRLYGSALATQTSKRTAGFLAESLLHEDPRYLPRRKVRMRAHESFMLSHSPSSIEPTQAATRLHSQILPTQQQEASLAWPIYPQGSTTYLMPDSV
jgi:hypothetical protein